jgi:hypothetical protein
MQELKIFSNMDDCFIIQMAFALMFNLSEVDVIKPLSIGLIDIGILFSIFSD